MEAVAVYGRLPMDYSGACMFDFYFRFPDIFRPDMRHPSYLDSSTVRILYRLSVFN
jgi:hypothetical protein